MSGAEMSDVQGLSGHKVIDNRGQKVGKVADVLFDEGTSEPQWALIEVGRLMRHQTAVPLRQAYRDDQGDLVVAYPADEVKHAPRLNTGTVLTHLEERHLREHYRMPGMT